VSDVPQIARIERARAPDAVSSAANPLATTFEICARHLTGRYWVEAFFRTVTILRSARVIACRHVELFRLTQQGSNLLSIGKEHPA